jgi:hypothetical protein
MSYSTNTSIYRLMKNETQIGTLRNIIKHEQKKCRTFPTLSSLDTNPITTRTVGRSVQKSILHIPRDVGECQCHRGERFDIRYFNL